MQALLISDNEVISSLYSTNLHAYVGVSVTIKQNHQDAIALLDLNPTLDIIICCSKIDNEKTALNLYNYLSKKDSDIPLVVVGPETELPKDILVIPGLYDVKGLVRATAKTLEITAKDMVEKPVPDYFPISINLFFNLDKVPSNVYMKVSQSRLEHSYVEILKKNEPIGNLIQKCKDDGASNLYVPAADRLKFINQASELILSELDKEELPIENRTELVGQGLEVVASQIFADETSTEEIMKISQSCVKSINMIVQDTPKLKNLMHSLLASKTKYIYMHSMLSSYVATQMLKHISWGGEGMAEKVSFVFFFHDIFLMPIFDKYPEFENEEQTFFNANNNLSEEEKEVIVSHAQAAGELIKSMKHTPIGADTIVTQHHGMINGLGFAVEFRDDISPLSKLAIIAEEFVHILLKHNKSDTKKEISKKKLVNYLTEKYKKNSYRKIIETLEYVEV